jgi:hypothetical protein
VEWRAVRSFELPDKCTGGWCVCSFAAREGRGR